MVNLFHVIAAVAVIGISAFVIFIVMWKKIREGYETEIGLLKTINSVQARGLAVRDDEIALLKQMQLSRMPIDKGSLALDARAINNNIGWLLDDLAGLQLTIGDKLRALRTYQKQEEQKLSFFMNRERYTNGDDCELVGFNIPGDGKVFVD